MPRCVTLALLLVASFLFQTGIALAEPRPRVGLVLSGGGALGATHIGVLKVLEELNVPVDIITGTSMGSIIGGLYATGLTAEELEGLVTSIDWETAFSDSPAREGLSMRRKQDDYGFLMDLKVGIKDGSPQFPPGLIQGQRLTLMLRALTWRARSITDFDQLPIRYRAVAADLETGKAVVLGKGNLATAMRASMAVPGVFPPVEIDGRLLVDGGVANNLPVDVARAMGAEVLIVVDIPTILKTREEIRSSFDVAGQMLSVLIQQNSLYQMSLMQPQDILIQPDLGTMSAADFLRIRDTIAPGEAAARKQADRLRALAGTPGIYANERAARGREAAQAPVISHIEIVNKTKLSDRRIRGFIRQKLGEPLDTAQIEEDFTRLYGLGDFEQIDYAIVEKDGQTGLEVTATEKSWAKDYLRFGLALDDNLEGDGNYSLGLGLNLTALNSFGAEWRTEAAIGYQPRFFTEFYQPLQAEPGFFVAPALSYDRRTVTAGEPDEALAQYRLSTLTGQIFVGRDFGTWATARVGYVFGRGEAERIIGTLGAKSGEFDIGEFEASVTLDRIDRLNFPRNGYWGRLVYSLSDRDFGASYDYSKINGTVNAAFSRGRLTGIVGVQAGYSLSGDLPLHERFTAGGLFNLSGYVQNSLSGKSLAMGRLVLAYALTEGSPITLDIPVYVGLSGEVAGIGRDDDLFNDPHFGSSVFLGVDSPLGPLYIAYGIGDGGQRAAYLYLGQPF